MLKQHYDKVLIACCFLFIFTNVGLASTAFSVHQPFIVALEGVGDTGGSLILSTRTLTSLVVMLFVDKYYHFLDVRKGVFIACMFTAGGFFVYSLANTLSLFIAGAIVLGAGYGLGGMVAMTYLANRWFTSGIGGVVGFASMGSGLASIVIPLIIVRVIEASSLSVAFRVEATIAACVGLVVVLLLRNRPSDLGMRPFEGEAGTRKRRVGHDMLPVPAASKFALLAAMAFVGVFSCCGITYLSVLATSSGFDAVFAATLVSAAGIALTIAKYAAGKLFDFIGAPKASAIMFSFAAIGFFLCCFAGTGNSLVIFAGAVAVGAGLSLGTVGISVWSIDLSNPDERSRQIKNCQVAYAVGGFIANTLPGIVKDLVGSYVVSYAAMIVVTIAAAAIILWFYHRYAARSGQ